MNDFFLCICDLTETYLFNRVIKATLDLKAHLDQLELMEMLDLREKMEKLESPVLM